MTISYRVRALAANLAARYSAPAAPEGWVCVPKVPTDRMRSAALTCSLIAGEHVIMIYRAMLAAAPQPPAESEQTPALYLASGQVSAIADGSKEWTKPYLPYSDKASGNFDLPVYLAARRPEPTAAKSKLIGWRTDDYLMETADKAKAENWSHHQTILPIFEGDPHTKLAAPEPATPLAGQQGEPK